MTPPRVVLARDGLVTYEPDFLHVDEADALLAFLREEIPWSQDAMTLFGRRVAFPRLTAWYGDPDAVYTYSGLRNEPRPWTPLLQSLRERLVARTGVPFNSVLLNFYRDGADAMGWHADDERELGVQPTIASLSVGGERPFQLRHRRDGETIALPLAHGSLLVMSGQTQHAWVHRLPKQRRVHAPRINLTYRRVVPPAP